MKGENNLQYSFKLNFNDKYYLFYDWLESDDIKEYQIFKYYKVDTKIINDLINYKIKFDFKEDGIYMFSDSFSFIAVLIQKGITEKISSVMLMEENKLKKIYLDLKYSKLSYKKLEKREKNEELRYSEVLKNSLLNEVNDLSLEDEDKIKYLYYEWFNKKGNNIKLIKQRMLNKLQKPITLKEKYIYELIIASK